ncbi:MAG TPA: mechanosensitive ion channel domain-containing protein [Longimicrobiales bacterium]|nr:mechanosensitive ion channel domain-containing protein [Longimicrobiales bacterium]
MALKSTLGAALALVLSAGAAWPQQPPATGDTVAAAAQPQLVELPPGATEVATRSSRLADSASVAEQAIAGLGNTAELDASVRGALRRQAELQALLASMIGSDYVRPERVSRLRDQAVLEDQRIEGLRARATERAEQLGRIREEWVARQSFWARWREALQTDPDRAAVEPDLARAQARIDTILERVSATLAGLLATQRTIEEVRASGEQLRGTLSAMRSGGRGALLEREQPLLFSAPHRAQLAENVRRAWRPGATLQLQAHVAFVRDHAAILLFHLLLAIALGLLARRIRRAARLVGDWSGLLEHPWALGSLATSVIALQRVLLAPPLWDVAVWSIFSASAAVLARKLFAAYALRLTVYIFAAFYPVFILFEAMQLPAPVFRTGLALVAAIALPGFALMARRRTAIATAENVSDPRRIWPLRVGAFMWALVLGAVILGYDSLARWVLHAAVTSGAVIFVVIVLLSLIRGAVSSLVVSDPGIRRHLALRVAVRLAHRLIFLVQIFTVIAAVLVLLDVWQLAESPIATWQRVIDIGFDAGPIRVTIGRILLGALVLYIAVVVSWLIRNVVQSEVYRRWDLDRGVGESINRLVHYFLITIGIFVALAVLGVELRNFAIVAGALGIGIGFGLQNLVSNFASGLILLFERPVRVGDTVIVGNEWGTITKIGLRSTIMLTFDQSEMIVPNTDLVSEKVVNWTLTNPTARVIMEVGVAYGTDIPTVLNILAEAGATHELTLSDPPPEALFMGFGDSSLDFELRVWVKAIRSRLQVRSVILTEIQRRFDEAGIAVPFPQRDLHVRSVDAAAARALNPPQQRSPAREGRID